MPGTGLCMEDGNEDDLDLRGLLAQRGNQKVSENYNTVGWMEFGHNKKTLSVLLPAGKYAVPI